MARIHRRFGGKQYRAESYHDTKREALARAKVLRERGHRVRVIKSPKDSKGNYDVWVDQQATIKNENKPTNRCP